MSWSHLHDIYAEARAYAMQEKSEPPLACPYDGEPLDPAPSGGLHCPLGNYDWPRERRVI